MAEDKALALEVLKLMLGGCLSVTGVEALVLEVSRLELQA